MKILTLIFATLVFTACGEGTGGNYDGVYYSVYDSDSFLSENQVVEYGCIDIDKDDLNLTGQEQIRLTGPDALLSWSRTKDSITFQLSGLGGATSQNKDLDFFKKGNTTTLVLIIEDGREISVDLRGDDC